MSCQLLDNAQISELALFAQMNGLGAAALVGRILHMKNLDAWNERYSESTDPHFELVAENGAVTSEYIYDLATYLYVSSRSNGYRGSKAFLLARDILSNAVFPMTSEPSFDRVVGQRVFISFMDTQGFILADECDLGYRLAWFDDINIKWCDGYLPVNEFSPVLGEENLFNLSIEQAQGLAKSIDQCKRDAEQVRLAAEHKEASAQAHFEEQFSARKPENAKAVIVAELIEEVYDESSMTSDFETTKRVFLAWSSFTRRTFKEMRKAAVNHPDTYHLSSVDEGRECREHYSIGRGTCLSSVSTRWFIKKEVIGDRPIKLFDWSVSNEVSTPAQDHVIEGSKPSHSRPSIILDTDEYQLVLNDAYSQYEIHCKDVFSEAMIKALLDADFSKNDDGFWFANKSDTVLVLARALLSPPQPIRFF